MFVWLSVICKELCAHAHIFQKRCYLASRRPFCWPLVPVSVPIGQLSLSNNYIDGKNYLNIDNFMIWNRKSSLFTVGKKEVTLPTFQLDALVIVMVTTCTYCTITLACRVLSQQHWRQNRVKPPSTRNLNLHPLQIHSLECRWLLTLSPLSPRPMIPSRLPSLTPSLRLPLRSALSEQSRRK